MQSYQRTRISHRVKCLYLKLKCNARATLCHLKVSDIWNNAGISMENRLACLDLRSKLTKSLVPENTARAWHLVVTSRMTQETSIPQVPSCCSRQACINNVCLWELSDFEMEFDILLHEYQPFDCVLQFSSVSCDVTSENYRQMQVRKYTILLVNITS